MKTKFAINRPPLAPCFSGRRLQFPEMGLVARSALSGVISPHGEKRPPSARLLSQPMNTNKGEKHEK
jgi:hypothetical protein